MLRRLLPHPLLSAFLVITWLLLVNSLSPGALVFGLLVAIAIPPLTTRFWIRAPRLHRPAVLLRLVPVVLWDILVANLTVAWIVLTRPADRLRPQFLAIPLDIRDPYATVALASIITLTPGTVSVQLDPDAGVLHVHALDCPDPEDAIAGIKRRYEQPLGELFEC
ncbi:Na+/H+ antiporter subunit E [Ectothiorhodospiraceae bacterium WFHF3C12]|nr:Na+/H+ antiporter subunit E [Ectothiorhodospiraceae bacterium WFHF3C12]